MNLLHPKQNCTRPSSSLLTSSCLVLAVLESWSGGLGLDSSTMRAHFLLLIARAAGRNSSSSRAGLITEDSGVFGAVGREYQFRAARDDLSGVVSGFDFVPGRRGFASVAAVDEEDDRPPSLRKSSVKKEDALLRAYPRPNAGKISCKKERKLGLVPSIIFEQENGHRGGNKQLISCERKQLDDIVNKIGRTFFLSKTYDLEIYDQPGGELQSREKVLPRTIHHSASDQLLNVTFMRALANSKVRVDIPIMFLGEDSCPGIKRGGYVNTIMRAVQYLCPVEAIPPFLEVDISVLDVGDKVLLRDLKVDPRLKLVRKDSSLPLLKIMGTRAVEAAVAPK